MANLVAEFTIEPFEAAAPGPHVQAAIDIAKERSADDPALSVEVGPFGTSIEGPAAVVLEIVAAVNEAAVTKGATRVSLQLTLATSSATSKEQTSEE